MQRLLHIALLLTPLICYLEWGTSTSAFLFDVEYSLVTGSGSADSFMHPMIFIPFLGQLLLLISIIKPNRKLALIGMLLQAILVVLILIVGILSLNIKIILSTLPFLIASFLFLRSYKSKPATIQ